MAEESCVGFTDTALGQYRGVSNKLAFERACAALCEGCSDVPSKSAKQLSINRWTVTYRCRKDGEAADFCDYDCVLVITKLVRTNGRLSVQKARTAQTVLRAGRVTDLGRHKET
jgi:hypothetical protein